LEHVLELLLHGLAGGWVGHLLFSNNVFEVQVVFHHKAGGQNVVVVNVLNEGLESVLSNDLLFRHTLGDTARGTLYSYNEGVTELFVLKCKNRWLTFLVSSTGLTMTAFLPACLPARRITTLPFFILKQLDSGVQGKKKTVSPEV